MQKPNAIPERPDIPRYADISTVVGIDLTEKKSNAAFRQWLITQGTALPSIEDKPDEMAAWMEKYKEYRKGQLLMETEGSIWHAVSHRWKYDRKVFSMDIICVLIAIAVLITIFDFWR